MRSHPPQNGAQALQAGSPVAGPEMLARDAFRARRLGGDPVGPGAATGSPGKDGPSPGGIGDGSSLRGGWRPPHIQKRDLIPRGGVEPQFINVSGLNSEQT